MGTFNRIDTTANRLKIAMKEAGKKQVDLVNATGIDKGSISHYVSGKYIPKQDTIYKLAKALDVSEMWLWGYDCAKERPQAQKNNDTIADIVIRLRTDNEFLSIVEMLNTLDVEKLRGVKQMLAAFQK